MTEPLAGLWPMFELRLAELRQDVDKVFRLVQRGRDRTKTFQELFDLISVAAAGNAVEGLREASRFAKDLTRTLGDNVARLPEYEDLIGLLEANDIVVSGLEKALQQLRTSNDQAVGLDKALDEVFRRLSKASRLIQELKDPIVDLDEISGGLTSLEASLNQCQSIIDDIDELGKKVGSDRISADAAWRELTALTERCLPLFADYVDFLGGLTLRDATLDNRVGQLADALLFELNAGRIAVPAGYGGMQSSFPTLFKLRFPEWTVWDVPLAGYDAGLVHADREGVSYTYRLPTAGFNDTFAKHLYAETYAALMVGPAYACAATLLRLRPDRIERSENMPSDLERAHVVFGALKELNADGEFALFVQRVEALWVSAVKLLGHEPVPVDAKALDRLVARSVGSLRRSTTPAIYDPDRWRSAVERSDQLLVSGSGPVLDVLNAAWRVRLDSEAQASLIAENIEKKWRWVRRRGAALPARVESRTTSAVPLDERPATGRYGGVEVVQPGHRSRS